MQGRPLFHGPLDRFGKLRPPIKSLPSIRMPIIARHLIGIREDADAATPRPEIIKHIAPHCHRIYFTGQGKRKEKQDDLDREEL
jgi:hypothetical protein